MRWRVEILYDAVAAELDAWPVELRVALAKIVERIEAVGLTRVREPHVKHLQGKLWEMRPSAGGKDGPGPLRHRPGESYRHRRGLREEDPEDAAALDRIGPATRERSEMMTIPFKDLRERWNADPAFREAYDRISPGMEIAFAIAEARHCAKLTQAQLAERIETSQSMVARWETGASLPSTKTLRRIAEATNTRLHVELVPS